MMFINSFFFQDRHSKIVTYFIKTRSETPHLPLKVRLGKKFFFVNSEILGRHIWRKKRVNYDKFEIATNCVNKIINLKAFCFFLLTGAT